MHAIQIGVLVRSDNKTGNPAVINQRNKEPFQVLGTKVSLTPASQDNYLRQAVDQTISLRNAMGWVSEGCDSSKPQPVQMGAGT